MKIKNIYVDINNELIIELNDGSIEKFDLYSIKRINSSYSDELKTTPSGLEIPDYLDDDD